MYPTTFNKPIALIGYSGHSYVVKDIFDSMGARVTAFCERNAQVADPFKLQYLGNEREENVVQQLKEYEYFVSIGENSLRKKVSAYLLKEVGRPLIAVDASAVVSQYAKLLDGVMVAPRAVINALAVVREGVICNTGSIVEHECSIGAFSHIAPGAVLCGNVIVGEETLIGANAVVRPGIRIGSRVRIGAGAVITKDVADGHTVIGHSHRLL